MQKWEKFSKQEIYNILTQSSTFTEMSRKFGYQACPVELKDALTEYALKNNIDISIAIQNRKNGYHYNKKDLLGQRFGKLIVFAVDEERMKNRNKKDTRKYWLCKCDCYKQGIVSVCTSDLTRGRKTHCQYCANERTNDLTGQKFGKLTPLYIDRERMERRKQEGQQTRTYWICKCDCGREVSVWEYHLTAGKTQSCGCLNSENEVKIRNLLEQEKIKYIQEYSFPDLCSDKDKKLRFDFAILNQDNSVSYLIEFNGKQHYYPIDFFGGEDAFKSLQERDKQKVNYCKRNNIPLIILTYKDEITSDKIIFKNLIN